LYDAPVVQAQPTSEYLEDCLSRRLIFFTGKGGVGKTTLAWATALACRRRGRRVVVASWNPLGSDSIEPPFQSAGIESVHLETLSAFREYTLHLIRFDTLYNAVFDNYVLKTFVMVAPGLSETVIAGKVWDLFQRDTIDLVIVDLPSSGHAVSFFNSPIGVRKIFTVGFVSRETDKILGMFQSDLSRVDLVTLPEELPLVESRQLKEDLQRLQPFHFGYLHVNQCTPHLPLPGDETLRQLEEPVASALARYRARVQHEDEAMGLADEVGLRQNRIPRFATEQLRASVTEVADFLERA
jgi:hypothetical protein